MKRGRNTLLAGATLFISACAVAPAPAPRITSPASPEAQEAPHTPLENVLGPDDASQKTDELIATQGKGAPSPGSADHGKMSQMPGMEPRGPQ